MMAEPNNFVARVRDLVRAAGIDNFRMERNILVMCGVRYVVEPCGCAEPDCNGLRLRREDRDSGVALALQHGPFPLGRA